MMEVYQLTIVHLMRRADFSAYNQKSPLFWISGFLDLVLSRCDVVVTGEN